MTDPIPLRAIDLKARHDAARAIALIEKHAALCEARGRQDDRFRTRTEEFLARLRAASETATSDIRAQVEQLGERLRAELQSHRDETARRSREIEAAQARTLLELTHRISAATRPLYDRFWALAVALIGALFLLSGFLAAKLQGWA